MKAIQLIFLLIFLVGCGQEDEKTTFSSSTEELDQEKPIKEPIIKDTIQQVISEVHETIQPEQAKEVVKYLYINDYGNKLDSNKRTLKIAENVITFFISNSNHLVLDQFKNKGFPMEFWATGMCPFYCIPSSELERKIAVAKNLGYPNVGYRCELISNGLIENKILTNRIIIKFMHGSSADAVDKVLSSKIVDQTKPLNHIKGQSYELSLKNRNLKSLINQFKQLRKNEHIEQIEFIFGGCENGVPID